MDYDKIIELDDVTLQDCEELYNLKGIEIITFVLLSWQKRTIEKLSKDRANELLY